MDVWTIYAMHATAAAVVALAAFWFVGRENLWLRRELDAVKAARANVSMGAIAIHDTLRKVWADRRHVQSAAAEKEVRLRRAVRRLWESRRRLQADLVMTTRTRDIQTDEYCRVALLCRTRWTEYQQADACSLAMCEELHRV